MCHKVNPALWRYAMKTIRYQYRYILQSDIRLIRNFCQRIYIAFCDGVDENFQRHLVKNEITDSFWDENLITASQNDSYTG